MCDSLVIFGKVDQFLLYLQQQYPVLLVAIQCVHNELLQIHSCAVCVLLCAAVCTVKQKLNPWLYLQDLRCSQQCH